MIKDENKVIIEEGSERELFVDASTSQPGIMIVDDGYFKVLSEKYLFFIKD